MQHINSYFIEQDLFNETKLRDHCDRHHVRMFQSQKLPHLALLHYSDEVQFDKLWDNFNRQCRGLVVDLKNKKLLAISYFKFFNVGESMAPSYEELVKLGSFSCSEKLDGSLGIAFYDQETQDVFVSTKGSWESEQTTWATNFARTNWCPELKHPKLLHDYTLMFEIIYYDNRVVVDYKKKGYAEGLYLVGVRENKSLKLLTYPEVQEFAKKYNLPTLKTYPFNSLDAVIDSTKTLPFMEEGYVIMFDSNQLMVKCKGSKYLEMHRFLSQLDNKHLLEYLIDGEVKDLIQAAPEEYRQEILETTDMFRVQALRVQHNCYEYFHQVTKNDRKEFAKWVLSSTPKAYHKFLFRIKDSRPVDLKVILTTFKQQKLTVQNLIEKAYI